MDVARQRRLSLRRPSPYNPHTVTTDFIFALVLAALALVAVSRGVDQRVHGHGTQHSLWKSMKRRLGRLKKNAADTPLLSNLLMGLFVQDELATEDDVDDVVKSWKEIRGQLNAGLEDVITTGGQP